MLLGLAFALRPVTAGAPATGALAVRLPEVAAVQGRVDNGQFPALHVVLALPRAPGGLHLRAFRGTSRADGVAVAVPLAAEDEPEVQRDADAQLHAVPHLAGQDLQAQGARGQALRAEPHAAPRAPRGGVQGVRRRRQGPRGRQARVHPPGVLQRLQPARRNPELDRPRQENLRAQARRRPPPHRRPGHALRRARAEVHRGHADRPDRDRPQDAPPTLQKDRLRKRRNADDPR